MSVVGGCRSDAATATDAADIFELMAQGFRGKLEQSLRACAEFLFSRCLQGVCDICARFMSLVTGFLQSNASELVFFLRESWKFGCFMAHFPGWSLKATQMIIGYGWEMKKWGMAGICAASIVPADDYLRRLSRLVHAVMPIFQFAKLKTISWVILVTPGNFVLEPWAAVSARALLIR
jgi:hypothetical protein